MPPTDGPVVQTIGHSNHPFETFAALLERAGIGAVLDVRSVPHSRRFRQFSRDALTDRLAARDMGYLYLGRELGARRDEPEAYVDGRADYDAIAGLPAFRLGLDRVLAEASARRVALMCAEREPLHCHRTILVARHLIRRGAVVEHLLADGGREAHTETERRLVASTGAHAPDLLAAVDDLPADPLARAYTVQGRRLAYRR